MTYTFQWNLLLQHLSFCSNHPKKKISKSDDFYTSLYHCFGENWPTYQNLSSSFSYTSHFCTESWTLDYNNQQSWSCRCISVSSVQKYKPINHLWKLNGRCLAGTINILRVTSIKRLQKEEAYNPTQPMSLEPKCKDLTQKIVIRSN